MYKPSDRACIEYGFRITFGYSVEDELYVMRNLTIIDHLGDTTILSPDDNEYDAMVVILSQMMKSHLDGTALVELRNDLVNSGVRKELADRVQLHLESMWVENWERLRKRVRFYECDNAEPIYAPTAETDGSS